MAQTEEVGGRSALADAARTLFAERGIDGVSMREIGRAAGHRNTNAVQYHFGGRESLVAEVLRPHHRQVADRRAALLDVLDDQPEPSIRDIAGALVRPSAALLEDGPGRDYLRIVAELIAEPVNLQRGRPLSGMGLTRWNRTARAHMPTSTLPLHRRFSAIHLCFTELGRRAAMGRRRRDHRLFVSDLVDLTTGVLGADVSDETSRLLGERDGRSDGSTARDR
jgi:AcrR family transcriptional regulator